MKIEDEDINVVPEVLVAEGELPDGIEEQEEILALEESNSTNNKRIAKNTMLLYFRMLLTMGVSLYTSRVVLEVLGIEDFGIYNVVGGIVVMFSFLNSAMSSATQRYFSFELGRGNFEELKKIFNITVNIHFLIAFVIVLLAETVGLWFLNNKLNIPEARMVAANWVYQFSIATFFMTVISVPYNAAIISHERMNVYAYVSIFEVLAKLGIVYLIKVLGGDKLAIYAGLLFVVAAIIRFIYGFYCNRNFKECRYSWIWDQDKYKELLSYAGWNLWCNLALVASDQGLNLILNIFFGPMINAARGISLQVNGVVASFITNIQVAINPQIVKSFSSNNREYMQRLVFQGSRFTFYLLLFLSLPIIYNTEYLLFLWLGKFPSYTIVFIRLVLFNLLINSLFSLPGTVVLANGDVKLYQLLIGCIQLLVIPIAYLLCVYSFPPEFILYALILVSTIASIFRMIMYKYLAVFSVKTFVKKVLLNVSKTTLVIVILVDFSLTYLKFAGMIGFLLNVIVISLIQISCIYVLGLLKSERNMIKLKILNCIN